MQNVSTPEGIAWHVPPDSFGLAAGEVHVWRADLGADAETIARCRGILSEDELVRADRFIRRVHGERFTCSRGALRCLLGRYLECLPNEVEFAYDALRKPRLSRDYGRDLRFNVSHSRDKALIAINIEHDIGADIEYLDSSTECAKIAKRFFSEAEASTLQALPASQHVEAFFNCWTRKEAYVKARGDGLTFGLDRFEVSLVPGEPARMLTIRDDSDAADRWVYRDVRPYADFVGAVAAHHDTDAWEFFEISADGAG